MGFVWVKEPFAFYPLRTVAIYMLCVLLQICTLHANILVADVITIVRHSPTFSAVRFSPLHTDNKFNSFSFSRFHSQHISLWPLVFLVVPTAPRRLMWLSAQRMAAMCNLSRRRCSTRCIRFAADSHWPRRMNFCVAQKRYAIFVAAWPAAPHTPPTTNGAVFKCPLDRYKSINSVRQFPEFGGQFWLLAHITNAHNMAEAVTWCGPTLFLIELSHLCFYCILYLHCVFIFCLLYYTTDEHTEWGYTRTITSNIEGTEGSSN